MALTCGILQTSGRCVLGIAKSYELTRAGSCLPFPSSLVFHPSWLKGFPLLCYAGQPYLDLSYGNIIYKCYHRCWNLKLCSDEVISFFEILVYPAVWHRWEFETSQFQAMDKWMDVTRGVAGGVTGTLCKLIPESINAYWFIKDLLCARHKRGPGTKIFSLYLYVSLAFCHGNPTSNRPSSYLFLWKGWECQVGKWNQQE